jgi:alkylhydroperoxidase family enzyme
MHGLSADYGSDAPDLADLEDRAALAAHLADKATGRGGITLDELDAALDRIGRTNHCSEGGIPARA